MNKNGDLGAACKNAGGHYNPDSKNHGDLADKERHEGDFGNIIADRKNIAKISITSNRTDLNKLIGR